MPTVFAVRSGNGNVSIFVDKERDTSKLIGLHGGDSRAESRERGCGERTRMEEEREANRCERRTREKETALFGRAKFLTLDIPIPTSRSDARNTKDTGYQIPGIDLFLHPSDSPLNSRSLVRIYYKRRWSRLLVQTSQQGQLPGQS